ncbi:MAG: hypothetical protein LBM08_11000 [Dysgonamonadaceae bacterium]|nr:hypothetical protein [Dysgonamonadaceae bacterium]
MQNGAVTIESTTIVSDVDPLFVNATARNYRLKSESPAIDVGDNTPYSIY